MFRYIFPKFEELKLLSIIILVISSLFSLTLIRFSYENYLLIPTIIGVFVFLFTLLYSRLIFMKFIAYKNGFEIILKQTYFNRFFLRSWDKISYYAHETFPKGIPTTILAIILYTLSFGFLIFTSIWNYKFKIIPHIHIGTQQKFEEKIPIGLSDYRYSKAIFGGFIFYFCFAFIYKFFCSVFEINYLNPLTIIMYWVAFFTLIPIFGSEGYELWSKNNVLWFTAFYILVTSMSALLIFQNLALIIFSVFIAVIIILIMMVWKVSK